MVSRRKRETVVPIMNDSRCWELCLPVMVGQDGTDHQDELNAVAMWTDGSTILAGASNGDWNASNLGDRDFTACKLDVDGNLRWKWQVTPVTNEYQVMFVSEQTRR